MPGTGEGVVSLPPGVGVTVVAGAVVGVGVTCVAGCCPCCDRTRAKMLKMSATTTITAEIATHRFLLL